MFFAKVLLGAIYLFPILGLGLAYYFGIYLPAIMQNTAQAYLQQTLKIGDKVVTKGGLIGTVFQTSKKIVVLSLLNGVLAEVERECICSRF